jgi:hypothetical protein
LPGHGDGTIGTGVERSQLEFQLRVFVGGEEVSRPKVCVALRDSGVDHRGLDLAA